MTGGILQLVARGYDDLYIINDPEITYFKIIYRRHTNFSMFPKILKFNQVLNFGKTGRCRILKVADLVHKLYLVINLPEIRNNTNIKIEQLMNMVKKYPELSTITDKLNEHFYNEDLLEKSHFDILYNLIKNFLEEQRRHCVFTEINKFQKSLLHEDNFYFPEKKDILKKNIIHTDLSKDFCEFYHKTFGTFAWVKELAHYLVDSVSVEIDGITMDNHTSELIRSFSLLNNDENKYHKYLEMIGHLEELYTLDSNTKPSKKLYLPLKFWFCRHSSSALPLCALQYTNIDIKVTMKDFDDVCTYSNISFKKRPKLSAYILAEYIYLDIEERERLATTKLEYLIEKFEIQENEIRDKSDIIKFLEKQAIEYKLNFKFSVKQILFLIKPLKVRDKINWFDYKFYDLKSNLIKPLDSIKIKFNGRDREINKDVIHFSKYDSYKSYCSSLDDNMFSYTFALYPQMLQPSGTANFGQLGDSSIFFILNQDFVDYLEKGNKLKISAYAFEYNIFRVFSGMGGLAFN